MDRALKKNIRTIYCMSFFQAAMVVSAVFVPLLQRHGLTMAEVLQTQAMFALVVAALEVPSGYLADVWGRKRAILAGQALILLAYGWFLFADDFVDFVVYEIIIGVGISLCSGADLALLYDSQAALNRDRPGASGGNHISRLVSLESYAGALAAIAASVLTLFSLEWVLVMQCGTAALALFFAARLVEVDRQLSLDGHRENLVRVVKLFSGAPLVLWTSVAIVIFGVASLLGFWLIQPYWESRDIPLHLFGYIWAVHGLVRGASAHLATAIERLLGWRRLFLLVAALPIVGFCGMSLLGNWTGILFGLLLPISRGLNMVVFYDALNRRVSATFRATVNSIVSLGTRLLFIFTGPVLGYLVDWKGVDVSLLGLAVLFLPVYVIVLVALSRSIRREPAGAAGAVAG